MLGLGFDVGLGVCLGLGEGVGVGKCRFECGVGLGDDLASRITGGLVGDGFRTGPRIGWVLIGFVPVGGTGAPGGTE